VEKRGSEEGEEDSLGSKRLNNKDKQLQAQIPVA
jgi:hypothetical protein